MTTLTADEIRSRVETDWNRIVKVLAEKVALQSISAKGITAEQMRTIDHDTMQKIVNTAFLLADNASGETNCIDAKMALKMQQAINEATTDE